MVEPHLQTPDLGTEALILTRSGDRHIATAWADFPGEWQYRDIDGGMSFVAFGDVLAWYDVTELLTAALKASYALAAAQEP